MPPNDHALIAWMQRQTGIHDVRVVREGDSVVVHFRKREILMSFDGVTPPVSMLGYEDIESLEYNWNSNALGPETSGVSLLIEYYWLVAGLALVVILISTRVPFAATAEINRTGFKTV